MRPVITAFEDSPDRGRGKARDMRVRWALEEPGLPHDVRLRSFADLRSEALVALQPFGQIPTLEQDGIALFEPAAIVLHPALSHPGLLPTGDARRARALSWGFAAVNTIEPPILERETTHFCEGDKPWHPERVTLMETRSDKRLAQLSDALGRAMWLENEFSAGDLVMAGVLDRNDGTELSAAYPNLEACLERAKTRPAFQRAYAAQRAVYLNRAGREATEGDAP